MAVESPFPTPGQDPWTSIVQWAEEVEQTTNATEQTVNEGRLSPDQLSSTIGEAVTEATTGLAHRIAGVTMMGLGDSQTANGGHTLPDPATSLAGNYYYGGPTWHLFAQILSGGVFDHIGNAATGGYTIQQIKATHLPAVLRIKPTICTVLAGENNKTTLSAADLDDLASIYDALTDAGILPVLCTIPPSSTIANVYRLNAWIRRQARLRHLPLADFHAALVDPATGLFAAGYGQDGSHPNAAGAMVMAQVLVEALAGHLDAGSPDLAADNIATGNLTPGPLFLTNAAGTSADNLPGSPGSPPFPTSGWSALTTFASGAFAFSDATPDRGRYFEGRRNAGVDNTYGTANWTFTAGDVIRIAFGLDFIIPEGGQIEVRLLPPNGVTTWTPFRAIFTQPIKGVMAFEVRVPEGLANYDPGYKLRFILTGADGVVSKIRSFTAKNLTAIGAI